jgi:polar amino acid transport system substrate-binding protein
MGSSYRVVFLATLFYMIISAAGTSAFAEERYTVVVNNAPPYRIIEHIGGRTGYSGAYIDVIDEISRRVGIRLQFVNVPFSRALQMMKEGEADMMLGPLWSLERASFMVYLKAQFPAEPKVFYLGQGVADIDDYDDLKNISVGVQRSSRYFEAFDQDEGLKKLAFDNYRAAFKALKRGYVDAVIIPERQGEYMTLQLGMEFPKATLMIPGAPSFITLSKSSGLLQKKREIEAVMSQLNQEGYLERLMVTYLE